MEWNFYCTSSKHEIVFLNVVLSERISRSVIFRGSETLVYLFGTTFYNKVEKMVYAFKKANKTQSKA